MSAKCEHGKGNYWHSKFASEKKEDSKKCPFCMTAKEEAVEIFRRWSDGIRFCNHDASENKSCVHANSGHFHCVKGAKGFFADDYIDAITAALSAWDDNERKMLKTIEEQQEQIAALTEKVKELKKEKGDLAHLLGVNVGEKNNEISRLSKEWNEKHDALKNANYMNERLKSELAEAYEQPRITVHILRNWDREKIVSFANHLLGNNEQERAAHLAQCVEYLKLFLHVQAWKGSKLPEEKFHAVVDFVNSPSLQKLASIAECQRDILDLIPEAEEKLTTELEWHGTDADNDIFVVKLRNALAKLKEAEGG